MIFRLLRKKETQFFLLFSPAPIEMNKKPNSVSKLVEHFSKESIHSDSNDEEDEDPAESPSILTSNDKKIFIIMNILRYLRSNNSVSRKSSRKS